MIDTHCHLNFKAFANDAHAVAHAMAKNHVAGIVVGCDTITSRTAIELAQTFPNLWASVGVHPIHVIDSPWDEALMKELALEERVVAIGEVGLDNYRLPDDEKERATYLKAQQSTFRSAINLATELDKPLIIHSRNAYDEIIETIRSVLGPFTGGTLRGTVHCYMGNTKQALALLDLGFMLGFTGVITYTDVDPSLLEVIEQIPLDRLLLETDAPYLTPEPYRSEGKKNSGKIPRNLPQYTLEVAKKIAAIRGMKYMDVIMTAEANAKRLFRIKEIRYDR